MDQAFVTGSIATPAGAIPKVGSVLTSRDRWGTIKARWGVGRMDYAIDPGLYALGQPDSKSPVLVTANYKMSFDYLRQAIPDRNAWILVLDTKGINVWCAAGKGTFGTEELVRRIELSGLAKVVGHRIIILPQLGAPGVAAHQVKQLSGFKVNYGPVRAVDLPAYLDGGMQKTNRMREITFPLKERAVLIPIELLSAFRPFLMLSLGLLALAGLLGPDNFLMNLVHIGLFAVAALFLAVMGGAVINPLLLPWLPGRAFSVKGLFIGLVIASGLIFLSGADLQSPAGGLAALSWLLIIPAVAAYLAMNFTGCSTYTSLSGVKKEMRFALPLEITAGVLGLAVWITSLVIA
ncbi:MAG: acetyl-CoA synthase subunit gamma [Deltaproteobacteria bacterium HGW-Deltaproteobacteria-6]|nr:MAG: acetyl-CoA synthase subunit gamma [Deltaproteobacteria bacterium HGW-Deltaproteobacteria-6]